eukprot:m.441979 g.441979  ORF g.441979 m.441979 type:complete len:160 (+) comp18732_c0_seq1:76-555(+)
MAHVSKIVAAIGVGFGAGAAAFMPRRQAQLHCQVPCGIFDDKARIGELNEHCTTITKAMTQVNNLAGKTDAQSLNQSVRWITAKEDHANKILTLVGDYFLAQRVVDVAAGDSKLKREAYLDSLEKHHRVMRAAMKTKQTTDPVQAESLRAKIHDLGHLY